MGGVEWVSGFRLSHEDEESESGKLKMGMERRLGRYVSVVMGHPSSMFVFLVISDPHRALFGHLYSPSLSLTPNFPPPKGNPLVLSLLIFPFFLDLNLVVFAQFYCIPRTCFLIDFFFCFWIHLFDLGVIHIVSLVAKFLWAVGHAGIFQGLWFWHLDDMSA